MSALAKVFKDPAKRAEFIFGQPMEPCPRCGGYNLRNQTPIVMDLPVDASPKQMLGAWARATKGGAAPLEGPVCIMCVDCRHKGPAVDCSGRTSEDVGQDPVVSAEMKRLWNDQNEKAQRA